MSIVTLEPSNKNPRLTTEPVVGAAAPKVTVPVNVPCVPVKIGAETVPAGV